MLTTWRHVFSEEALDDLLTYFSHCETPCPYTVNGIALYLTDKYQENVNEVKVRKWFQNRRARTLSTSDNEPDNDDIIQLLNEL